MLYRSVERFIIESCFSFISFASEEKNKDERFQQLQNFLSFFNRISSIIFQNILYDISNNQLIRKSFIHSQEEI